MCVCVNISERKRAFFSISNVRWYKYNDVNRMNSTKLVQKKNWGKEKKIEKRMRKERKKN